MPHLVRAVRRRRFAVTITVLATIALGVGAVGMAAAQPRVTVDGIAPSDAELTLAADRAERTGADPDDSTAGFDILRDDLALFAVARSVGASDVTRPADILDVLDKVNAERRGIADDGGVLYGPVQYDAASFYGKSITDIRTATLTRIESGAAGIDVSDAEVRARFDADPGQWADAATTYHLTRFVVPGSDGAPDPAVLDAVRTGAVDDLSAASAPEQVALTSDQIVAGALSPENTAALTSAADGDLVGPFPAEGEWVVLRLDSRTVDADAAFTHYASRIRSVLYGERLDALIAEARDAQAVTTP